MFTAITFLFCILAGRFFYVQVVWSGQLGYRALDQWMREIPVVAERGLVTDRNGVVLAENNTSYTVFARSNAVKDKTGTARLLSDCLGVDGDTLLKKLESVKASEITVARHVGKGAIETLAEANPEGVYSIPRAIRFVRCSALLQPTIRVPQGSKNITINISRGRTGNCFTKPTLSVSTLRARLLPIAPPRTA